MHRYDFGHKCGIVLGGRHHPEAHHRRRPGRGAYVSVEHHRLTHTHHPRCLCHPVLDPSSAPLQSTRLELLDTNLKSASDECVSSFLSSFAVSPIASFLLGGFYFAPLTCASSARFPRLQTSTRTRKPKKRRPIRRSPPRAYVDDGSTPARLTDRTFFF